MQLPFNDVLEGVRKSLVKQHGTDLLSMNGNFSSTIRNEVRNIIGHANENIEEQVISYIIGLGPVDELFKDPLVSEVMINGPNNIYIERNGKLELTDISFPSEDVLYHFIDRIVRRCGRKIDFSNPLAKARLPDGSRVNVVRPPSSPFPVVTIRRFVKQVFTTDELLKQNYLNREMVTFFETLVQGKANIVIAGSTGSGKTTFMRWLCGFIPEVERIITLELVRELALEKNLPHVIPMESTDKAAIYDLMLNALHMRPDRIILCEILGAEAFELLQALGTGHDGAMTTVHTYYGKKQAIHRMVRQMIKAGNVSAHELRSMIAETIDFLVFVKRFKNGTRGIVNVCQVMENGGEAEFQDIYAYRFDKKVHECCGQITPDMKDRLKQNLMVDNLPDIHPFQQGVN